MINTTNLNNCFSGETFGCTYPNADNYNPSATIDDGSCVFTINTGSTFQINTYGTHYQECNTAPNRLVGFAIHIPQINSSSVISDFDMFIKFYAYPYLLDFQVYRGCNNLNEQYVSGPQSTSQSTPNDELIDRVTNNRFHVVHIDSLTPNFSMFFNLREDDSDFGFGTGGATFLPIDITIIADNVLYQKTDQITIGAYNSLSMDGTEIITVN